jgi:NADPH-dependent curcumin reductase CurA
MSPFPQTGREVRLAINPSGLPRAEHFEVVTAPLTVPKQDEVLVRNLYFRVSSSLRMMISEGAADIAGVPFPALRPGDALAEEAVGEVISAPAGRGLSPGDLVLHFFGWREHAVVPVSECQRVEDILPDPAAHLSHGWTAYAALTRGVDIRPGDSVFVSSAAGAIGSMAGQIARMVGAAKVFGSTSSQDKANRLISDLGYDAVVIRDGKPIGDQLAELAPEGLDVVVDNVGGEQLQAVVAAARRGARILVLGALSGQLKPSGAGRSAPVELDSFQLLLKEITIRGYSADRDAALRPEWTRKFAAWLRSGEISIPHAIVEGIEHAPQALEDTIAGRFFGTVLVKP